MNKTPVFALLVLLAACAPPQPYSTTKGALAPNATMTIKAANSQVNVYKPAVGEPADAFTVAAYAPSNQAPSAAPTIRRAGTGIVVEAPAPLGQLLVRTPDRVNLVVDATQGSVNVTDISGNVNVSTASGDVHVMIPGYAQASTGKGTLSVTFGAMQWPGTLRFASGNGDIEVYIPEMAKFHVHMHTDDGTLFSDFGLRGTSTGTSETIDGSVNGGASQGVSIETKHGTIRLLRLAPQA